MVCDSSAAAVPSTPEPSITLSNSDLRPSSGVVGMIPSEHLGVVVLTNRLPTQLPFAVELKIFDLFLGNAGPDWSADLKVEADRAEARAAAAPPVTTLSTPNSVPLASFVGSYESDLYGAATVSLERGVLVLRRPAATAALKPQGGDRFAARWTSAGLLSVFGETPLGFAVEPGGRVSALQLGPDRWTRVSTSLRAEVPAAR